MSKVAEENKEGIVAVSLTTDLAALLEDHWNEVKQEHPNLPRSVIVRRALTFYLSPMYPDRVQKILEKWGRKKFLYD